jgi:hypothetical protein
MPCPVKLGSHDKQIIQATKAMQSRGECGKERVPVGLVLHWMRGGCLDVIEFQECWSGRWRIVPSFTYIALILEGLWLLLHIPRSARVSLIQYSMYSSDEKQKNKHHYRSDKSLKMIILVVGGDKLCQISKMYVKTETCIRHAIFMTA